jgi:trans-aconitate 2-methyltransferase
VDLVARIPLEETRVRCAADLGCGPGNSTAVLAGRFPHAQITGVDHSAAMLERARGECPGLRFEEADVRTWRASGPMDVILSNAVFQWIEHHEQLLPRLLEQLSAGGVLAVQLPRNLDAPWHELMREVASTGPWAGKISGRSPDAVQTPEWYFDLLRPICAEVDLWETEYIHVMADHEAIVEWGRGTALRPYLDALDPAEQERFLSRYLEAIRRAYPARPGGEVLFPFRRIFFVATKRS